MSRLPAEGWLAPLPSGCSLRLAARCRNFECLDGARGQGVLCSALDEKLKLDEDLQRFAGDSDRAPFESRPQITRQTSSNMPATDGLSQSCHAFLSLSPTLTLTSSLPGQPLPASRPANATSSRATAAGPTSTMRSVSSLGTQTMRRRRDRLSSKWRATTRKPPRAKTARRRRGPRSRGRSDEKEGDVCRS